MSSGVFVHNLELEAEVLDLRRQARATEQRNDVSRSAPFKRPPTHPPAARLLNPILLPSSQVLRLEQKLGDLHGTDVTSLWRAYRTLCEHVESLQVESRGISDSIDSMRTSVVTVEEAAHEIAVSSGLLFALNLARTALKGFNIKVRDAVGKGEPAIVLRLDMSSQEVSSFPNSLPCCMK